MSVVVGLEDVGIRSSEGSRMSKTAVPGRHASGVHLKSDALTAGLEISAMTKCRMVQYRISLSSRATERLQHTTRVTFKLLLEPEI